MMKIMVNEKDKFSMSSKEEVYNVANFGPLD
jgi:hypothetical protein